MSKYSVIAYVIMPAVFIMSGCGTSSVGTMSEKEFEQRTEKVEYNTVIFTDYKLNRQFSDGLVGPDNVIRISAKKHGIGRTDTGISQVWAVLRNHTDYNYMVEARTHFFDKNGMPVDAKPVWKRVSVPANSLARYKEKSVSNKRLQYRVEVRQAK